PGCKHRERDHVVDEADAEDGQEDRDQQDARQRPSDDRGADRDRRAAVEVPERDADRQRDGGTDPERRARQLELLERLVREEAGMVADEAEALEERVRVGGVEEDHVHLTSTRRVATRRRSKASASATTSAPAE